MAYNFKDIPIIHQNIKDGNFDLRDAKTNLKVEFKDRWDKCFCREQRVTMRLYDTGPPCNQVRCPHCGSHDQGNENDEIKWYVSHLRVAQS